VGAKGSDEIVSQRDEIAPRPSERRGLDARGAGLARYGSCYSGTIRKCFRPLIR
jgi:hypothetical protein